MLEKEFESRFESIIQQDDCLPMYIEQAADLADVLDIVWLEPNEREALLNVALPASLPWSQSFYLCCQDIRHFVQNFYQFIEGVAQHHRNIDDLLSKALNVILCDSISKSIGQQAERTSNLSQIAQIVSNLEHFEIACGELERSLTNIRSSQRGGTIRVNATKSFSSTLSWALNRVNASIKSKLDDFFGLSEYDWTPNTREDSPSMYLYELVNWLTTVVDSLVIKEGYKDKAYRTAVEYLANCLMDFLCGRDIPMINDNALSNLLVDVDFLNEEFKRIGRPDLASVFVELRSMTSIVMSDTVQEYLVPSVRQTSYPAVRPKRLQSLLEKLARAGAQCRDAPSRERGEKRRKEAEAVGRVFPGENR